MKKEEWWSKEKREKWGFPMIPFWARVIGAWLWESDDRLETFHFLLLPVPPCVYSLFTCRPGFVRLSAKIGLTGLQMRAGTWERRSFRLLTDGLLFLKMHFRPERTNKNGRDNHVISWSLSWSSADLCDMTAKPRYIFYCCGAVRIRKLHNEAAAAGRSRGKLEKWK